MSLVSNLARSASPARPSLTGEWDALFGQGGTGSGIPLGTARWMSPEAGIQKFGYSETQAEGRVWIGEGFDWARTSLGYEDDRHVCLVSGSRGGKGVGVIVPTLCFWPGSTIVVDPKGENASVTARRRGNGSDYAQAMGQKVCILDPFGEVQLEPGLKARFNPLDAIDPEGDTAIDDAARVAAAIVVVESKTDPYWEQAARNLIKGIILHVLSARLFEGRRNLVTVRRLLTQGDWLTIEQLREAGDDTEDMPSAFEVLWSRMRRNPAFNGVVAGVGEQMIAMADKQRSGVIEAARTNTEFLDSLPMQRILETSDFGIGELKTNPRGLTIYLTLPQRFMETHYRWLRLMIVLALGEMERIKGRPATGQPTLFVLDEFAGLKRMEPIENAAAQAAGFGVKFLFVVQNLPQLEDIYEKGWETFLGNSGLKLFFQIDDDFTRSYLSRQLGEVETVRETRSGSHSLSTSISRSTTRGDGVSENSGGGKNWTPFLFFNIRSGISESWGSSTSHSASRSRSRGSSQSASEGWGEAVHKRPLLNPDEIGRLLARVDDRRRPGYPGLVLALVPGEHPLLARRVNYFEAPRFQGYFDPHPNYPAPSVVAQLAWSSARRLGAFRRRLAASWRILRGISRAVIWVLSLLLRFVSWVVGAVVLAGIAAVAASYFGFLPLPREPAAVTSPKSPVVASIESRAPNPEAKPANPEPKPTEAMAPAAPVPPPQTPPAYAQGIADWDALQA